MKPPFKHQTEGVEWLLSHPHAVLGDVMRLGKTRQAIDLAQALFERKEIDSAIVVAPGEIARSVWADPEKGEIVKFTRVPVELTLIRATKTTTVMNEARWGKVPLSWYVTNYELARRPERLSALLGLASKRTLLILDEGVAVKSPTSKQTRAMYDLRQRCGRVVILNGTPSGDNPGDLYAPFKILDPAILGCSNWYQFQAKYAIMGGFRRLVKRRDEDGKWRKRREPVQIVGWTNLEDLYARTAPFILRRTLDQVFPDMPKALDPVSIEVPLSAESWRRYKQFRDTAILELESGRVTAAQAGVLSLRLSQLTSGYVSGVNGDDEPVDVSREKLDAVLRWHEERLEEDNRFRAILWCRFRYEAERLAAELAKRSETRLLYGGQTPEERTEAVRLLGPGCEDRAANLVGIARTGGLGLDLSGASTTGYVSNDYSFIVREQSEARPLGPNQKWPCAYFDWVATGPDGQRTVDHTVLKALRGKEDLASWGATAWAAALREEE